MVKLQKKVVTLYSAKNKCWDECIKCCKYNRGKDRIRNEYIRCNAGMQYLIIKMMWKNMNGRFGQWICYEDWGVTRFIVRGNFIDMNVVGKTFPSH